MSSAGQTVARRPDSAAAWALATAVMVMALAACGPNVPLPDGDRPLDALARPTLSGDRFDPQSLAGQVVVVNFWSPG